MITYCQVQNRYGTKVLKISLCSGSLPTNQLKSIALVCWLSVVCALFHFFLQIFLHQLVTLKQYTLSLSHFTLCTLLWILWLLNSYLNINNTKFLSQLTSLLLVEEHNQKKRCNYESPNKSGLFRIVPICIRCPCCFD